MSLEVLKIHSPFSFVSLYCMWMGVLALCMFVYHGIALSEKRFRSPETGVTGYCEPLCACWELDHGPLKEHSVISMIEPLILSPQIRGMKGTEIKRRSIQLKKNIKIMDRE